LASGGVWESSGSTRKRAKDFHCSIRSSGATQIRAQPVVLYEGMFDQSAIERAVENLGKYGSKAAPGFMNPEGIIIYHQAAKLYFKKTLVGDEKPKGSTEAS